MNEERLEEYKGRTMDKTTFYDLMDKAELTKKIMSVIFQLRMDDRYTKERAIKDLLDVVTERLDFEFINEAAERSLRRDYLELERLQQRVKELEAEKKQP